MGFITFAQGLDFPPTRALFQSQGFPKCWISRIFLHICYASTVRSKKNSLSSMQRHKQRGPAGWIHTRPSQGDGKEMTGCDCEAWGAKTNFKVFYFKVLTWNVHHSFALMYIEIKNFLWSRWSMIYHYYLWSIIMINDFDPWSKCKILLLTQ